MANTVTAHTILNGPRNLIVQYNIVADGSGNETSYELLDVLDYTGQDQKDPNDFKVVKVTGTTGTGTTVELDFGNADGDDRLFFQSPPENTFCQEWPGGLSTLLVNPDMTIKLTTLGFDAANDLISLTIWIKKKTKLAGN